MGFGVLFFSCFLTYFGALTPIGTFTYVLGSGIMLFALYKLSSLNKMFAASAVSSALLLMVSLSVVVMFVFGFESNAFYDVVTRIQNYLSPAVLLCVLTSIYLVSKEVGLRKIQGWSIVDGVFVIGYVFCDILSIFVVGDVATPRLGLVCVISQILFSVFLLVIIFNCYARICYEDDRNMEKNTSGVPVFDFLNKMFNKATDKSRKNKPNDKEEK